MAVIASKVSSSNFTYLPTECVFSAFMSDLSAQCIAQAMFNKIWNDSEDDGFIMVSEKTQAEVIFCYNGEQKNRDGDIMHWEWVALDRVNGKEFIVKVFNT